jgi:hypothetical protein
VAASLVRYLKDFSAVVQAVALGAAAHQIPVITGLSASLVQEYLVLLAAYDTPEHHGMLERIRHPLAPPADAEKGGLQ